MSKQTIIDNLDVVYQDLFSIIDLLDEEKFNYQPTPKKWIAGQHLQHLIMSTKPLNKALRVPKFLLKGKFGTNNRDEKSEEQIIEKYKNALVDRNPTNNPYVKDAVFEDKEKIAIQLRKELESLKKIISKWTEKDMGKYILPHPLLGKLTIREMMYFTVYHTKHHTTILREEYL